MPEHSPSVRGPVFLFWAQIVGNAGLFVGLLLVTRALGPSGRGTVAFLTVTALVTAWIARLGVTEATVIFAAMHPAGAGVAAGLQFGVLLAVFQLGSFVLHNHMLLNIGRRQSTLQGIAFTAEWIAVGVVISLVYRG
jgi:uncharacterized membrane protein